MPRCKKIRYKDRIGAQYALAVIMDRAPGPTDLKRIYKCHLCRGWHLTSRDLKEHYGR